MNRKCIVNGCENREDQGYFIGDICASCHEMLIDGDPSKQSKNFIRKLYDNKMMQPQVFAEVESTDTSYRDRIERMVAALLSWDSHEPAIIKRAISLVDEIDEELVKKRGLGMKYEFEWKVKPGKYNDYRCEDLYIGDLNMAMYDMIPYANNSKSWFAVIVLPGMRYKISLESREECKKFIELKVTAWINRLLSQLAKREAMKF